MFTHFEIYLIEDDFFTKPQNNANDMTIVSRIKQSTSSFVNKSTTKTTIYIRVEWLTFVLCKLCS